LLREPLSERSFVNEALRIWRASELVAGTLNALACPAKLQRSLRLRAMISAGPISHLDRAFCVAQSIPFTLLTMQRHIRL
jgi:hypothetical protein